MSMRNRSGALLPWQLAALAALVWLTACDTPVVGIASVGKVGLPLDSPGLQGRWRATNSGCSGWSQAQYLVSPSRSRGRMTIELLSNPMCSARSQLSRGFEVNGELLQLDTLRLLELGAKSTPGLPFSFSPTDLTPRGWARVLATGDTLRLVTLDSRKLSSRLASRPGDVPHLTRRSTIILTGDSEQTAAFLLRAFSDPALVSSDTGEFVWVPP